MEMHQVRYFLAVARELNFTRAAEACHVAQPSLTRAIKQLEDELGGELFRRERNLSHLTELGQRMLPMLQQCFDSASSAKSLAQSIKSGSVAQLAIALSVNINLMLFTPFLMEIVRAFPGIELKFFRGTNDELVERLKKGDADVAIGGNLAGAWDRLDTWLIFREPYQLLVSKKHPLADSKEPIAPALLLDNRFIQRVNCDDLKELTAYLSENGASPVHPDNVTTEQDALTLLGSNLGVTIAPRSSSTSNTVVCLDLKDLSTERQVYVAAVAGRQRSLPANTFIKMLRSADWREVERKSEFADVSSKRTAQARAG